MLEKIKEIENMPEHTGVAAVKSVSNPEYPWSAGVILSGVLFVLVLIYGIFNQSFDFRLVVPFIGVIFFFSVGLWLNVYTETENGVPSNIKIAQQPSGISSWAFSVAWILLAVQLIIWVFYKFIK